MDQERPIRLYNCLCNMARLGSYGPWGIESEEMIFTRVSFWNDDEYNERGGT
jgi:hypothetical protein